MPFKNGGFFPYTQFEIRTYLEEIFKKNFGSQVKLNSKGSPMSSIFNIENHILELLDKNIGYAWSMSQLDTATGVYLDKLAKFSSNIREKATHAVGVVTFSGVGGTIIPEGFLVSQKNTGITFKTLEEVIIPAGVDTTVKCNVQALEAGLSGNIAEHQVINIVTSLEGLHSVDNELPFTGGADIETDENFRKRIKNNFFSNIGNFDNITRELKKLSGVSKVIINENNTLEKVNELPPLSVQIIIQGGSEHDIANALKNVIPLGVQTYGEKRITIKDSENNKEFHYYISRPKDIEIFCKLIITHKNKITTPAINVFKSKILNFINSFDIGRSLSGSEIIMSFGETLINQYPVDSNNIVKIECKLSVNNTKYEDNLVSKSNEAFRIKESNIFIEQNEVKL